MGQYWIQVAWNKNEDIFMIDLFDNLLNNGQAGLIDLNLIKAQKVLDAYSSENVMKDYSTFELSGVPRDGQNLDEVKDLLLAELKK